jgi:hypothetical protein
MDFMASVKLDATNIRNGSAPAPEAARNHTIKNDPIFHVLPITASLNDE